MTSATTRDSERRLAGGVCAGIARSYSISPLVVRLGWLLVTVVSGGLGALVYMTLWALLPSGRTKEHDASSKSGATPRRAVRVVAGLLWLFLVLLLLQGYLAGVFLLGGIDGLAIHQGLGYMLAHYYPLLVTAAALVARMPARFWATFGVLFILLTVQPAFIYFSTEGEFGWVRGLHVPNALVVTLLVYRLARSAEADDGYGRDANPSDARVTLGSSDIRSASERMDMSSD